MVMANRCTTTTIAWTPRSARCRRPSVCRPSALSTLTIVNMVMGMHHHKNYHSMRSRHQHGHCHHYPITHPCRRCPNQNTCSQAGQCMPEYRHHMACPWECRCLRLATPQVWLGTHQVDTHKRPRKSNEGPRLDAWHVAKGASRWVRHISSIVQPACRHQPATGSKEIGERCRQWRFIRSSHLAVDGRSRKLLRPLRSRIEPRLPNSKLCGCLSMARAWIMLLPCLRLPSLGLWQVSTSTPLSRAWKFGIHGRCHTRKTLFSTQACFTISHVHDNEAQPESHGIKAILCSMHRWPKCLYWLWWHSAAKSGLSVGIVSKANGSALDTTLYSKRNLRILSSRLRSQIPSLHQTSHMVNLPDRHIITTIRQAQALLAIIILALPVHLATIQTTATIALLT